MARRGARRVINERTGQTVATAVREATGPWQSFKGLMLRKSLPDGHSLLFRPAPGIHTQFMRFPIDLVFLDREQRVTKAREAMRPWWFDFTTAAAVIELNAGTASRHDIRPGDRLRFVDGQ